MNYVVDAYVHCGLSNYKPLAGVVTAMEGAGVERAVLVQHLGEYDNSYIGGVVAAQPERFTGVCLVDTFAPDPVRDLDRWLAGGCFGGIRLELQHLERAPRLYDAAVERGLNIVLCTIGGLGDSLHGLRTFLAAHPDCSLTLTHWGWPRAIDAPDFEPYREVLELAKYPGVFLQLSGLGMFAADAPRVFHSAVSLALDAFGDERLVWGSNFPVSGRDAAGYRSELRQFIDGELALPAASRAKILGGNAARRWFVHHS